MANKKLLSYAQKEILQIEQFYENTSINNIAGIVHMNNGLGYDEVNEAFNKIIEQHDTLRIRVTREEGEYKQYLVDYEHQDFEFVDFYQDEVGYDKWVRESATMNIFNLDEPLYRVIIAKAPQGHYVIFLLQHHLISDAWGVTIVVDNLSKKLVGKEDKETESAAYFEAISTEMDYETTKRFTKDKDFWLEKLENFEDNILFEKTTLDSAVGKRISINLLDQDAENVKRFCEENDVSISNLFSAIMHIIKHKKTLSKTNSVGLLIHNRNNRKEKTSTGVFSRVLPIIVEMDKEATVKYYLNKIKLESLNVLKHRKYPYEYIVENSGNKKGLVDCFVSFQNAQYDAEFMNDGFLDEWLDNGTNNAPLSVNISNRSSKNGLDIDYDYQIDVLDEAGVYQLHETILHVLNSMIEAPERKIKDIEIVSGEEREMILNDFNNTDLALNNSQSFIERFEEQVSKFPNKTAIKYEGESLTYKAFNAKVNQMAYRLRSEGVESESLVAVMANRSLEMLVAIYGIIKAGGAYVPIDPNYPADRINYILEDSQATVLLTDNELQETISYDHKVIDISNNETLASLPTANLEHITDVNNLMYVIYTSGTTGKPKGVLVSGESLMNRLNWLIDKYGIGNEDIVFFKTPFTFDVSVWEVFGFGMIGAQAVLLPSGEEGNPEKITSVIQNDTPTMVHFVPSMFNVFINFIKATNQTQMISSLRYVLASGEALKPSIVNQFNELIGSKNSTQLINLYGPTEATIDVTSFDFDHNVKYDVVPIGKPIANTQAYILNEDNNVMGIGVPGELCIGGINVTRGYLNRPELTQEKFVNNPFGEGKIYRTGDLAQWNNDGNISYLGRIDEQVKIRGYRIELGEIESILRKNDDILNVAVVAKPIIDDELSICTYIVSDQTIDFESLKAELSQQLPEYMVPTYMMQVEELPVSSSGKLNKKALPEIKVGNLEYVAPRNDMEAMVVDIFSATLNIERVSIFDNFFEIGGHSLKAISVINEIESKTNKRLPLKKIFDNPTAALLSKVIDSEVSDAIERRIPLAETKPYYLTSSPQKRLYVLNEMVEGQTAYNMASMLEIRGEVDVERVRNTFQALVDRHEALRTHFDTVDGEPVQIIDDEGSIQIDYEETQTEDYDTLLSDFVKPFDLTTAPLLRVKVVKCAEKQYILLFDMHHIISDGFSINLIIKEFTALYKGRTLDELTVQYKDYSEWMRSRDLAEQRQFWVSQFKEEAPVLDLPYDYARPNQQSFTGRTVSMDMPEKTRNAINQLSQATGTTDYMILLSSFMVLLHKYSRQEDIVVGSPISGRTHKDTENMLGMFVNTLAMRSNPERNKSFEQLLAEVKDTSLQAFDNQEYPLEALVDEIVEKRDLTRNPLFDVLFTLQNNENESFQIDDWSTEQKEASFTNAKFDLSMTVYDNNGYKIALEYAQELFEQDTIERMLTHFMELLSNIADQPTSKISEIEMVTQNERDVIFNDFNNTTVPFNNTQTFVERFENQVAKTPDKTAISYEGESLSYHALNERANQLAYQLRNEGVTANSLVALMTNRRLEMIIGIYGILKAGGAYVPVDPNYPKDRINYILEDSQATVLLTDRTPDSDIAYDNTVIDITKNQVLKTLPTTNLEHITDVSNLMYVIYTSGTTGRPKGVLVAGESVMNRLNWVYDKYHIDSDDIICFKTPFTFDVSVWEIFGFAMVGAQAVLLPSGEEGNPEQITSLIQTSEATMVHFVPSMFNVFINYIKGTKQAHLVSSLRYVLASGEALKPELVNQFNEYIGGKNNTQLINLYGPTEATIDVTSFETYSDVHYTNIPIGKPIANTQAYILDEDNHVMGIGVSGELVIGGVNVTEGYLNRPELTQEKFVDNPFGEGKLYRTGDLARWNADGNISYSGRIDEQVKIRGYRIELGEIESVLRQNKAILDVAVITKPMVDGELAICVYIVSDQVIDFDAVKTELNHKLPDYMVPSYMTQIDELPVSSSGKLNKRALPEIKVEGKVYVAPETETESMLASIFESVLNIEKVSTNDNFFEIGGHSLKAIGIINKIESEVGKRLPLKLVFESPTIAQLAKVVDTYTDNGNSQSIPQAESKPYYLASSPQKRLYVLNEMVDGQTAYNMPSVLEIQGNVDVSRVEDVFQKLVNRHEALRTHFETIKGEPVQVINDSATIVVDYQEINEEDEFAILNEFVQPFDLGQAPLLRVKIAKIAEQRYVLLYDMHHIISDGFSINIIMKEFSALYHEQALEPLSVQYKDYSEWMQARDLNDQREFWLSQFENEAPVLDLPYDYARPNQQSFTGKTVSLEMPEDVQKAIHQLSQTTGSTDYMILLSSFMVLLHKYSRQEDVVVGSPISGRTHRDTEDMLGMFVNTLAMRSYPERNKTFSQLLDEVRELALKAYDNQEYPLEALLDEVVEKRDLTRNPLFDVLFTLQNNDKQSLQIDDWLIQKKETSNTNAKFDLSMTIHENEDYKVSLEYAQELFSEDTIERMLAHFVEIISSVVRRPEQNISDIEIITDAERETILNQFNDTELELNNTVTFVERFEKQVEQTPNKTAITFEGEHLTYQALNERANQVAYQLRNEGVKPNDLVGIMSQRRLEMMIGIYGILKAGGAYVPLDPNHPHERTNFILQDSNPRVLLTDEKIDYDIKFDNEIIKLTNNTALNNLPTENLPLVIDETNLMYIIYTSGTTGKPKGVMVPYSSVMNRLNWMVDYFGLGTEDKILFKTPFTFDVSIWEVFGWAVMGGEIIMLRSGEESNPEKIASVIDQHDITMTHFVPSMLSVFIDFIKTSHKESEIASLNHVFTSGEALKAEHVNQFNDLVGLRNNTLLYNLYGPTETTVEVTYYPVFAGQSYTEVPIGKPIANSQAYIMNEDNNLLGIGVPGELCIGGTAVTNGYLNRPDLTADKFVDNPFGEGKMYRTGDLVKWSKDGQIDYIGRIDEQVKIRGYRIELGEIESSIAQIDNISEVAVVTQSDENNADLMIAAYVVSESVVDFDSIKTTLGKQLPDYMIPTLMMQIDSLPVTANGKLDKKGLPKIKLENKAYVEPRNATEATIAEVYGEVLNLDNVSALDNFFEIGGHSLRAISVINEIESKMSVRMPLKAIFENPTVSQLSKAIGTHAGELSSQTIPLAETKAHYLASSPQKRLYVLNEMMDGQTAYNMPSMLEVRGEVDVERVQSAFQSLVNRHEALRTHFDTVDSEPVQIIDEQANITVDYEEVSTEDYEQLLNRFIRPFNLAHAPLLRVKVVKCAEQRYVLLFDMHHIISDGFSINLIIKEFTALYHGQALETLTAQYKDYSEWMHTRDLSDQRSFWLSQFEEDAPVLDLPYDHARSIQQSYTGKSVSVEVPEELRQEIQKLSQTTGSTDFMILLASFNVLLHKYSRQEDIVVGSPISGRTHKDTENMLGMFVNTLAMRAYPERSKTFNQLLSEVKDTALKAYDNQEYPLEALVDEIVETRDLTRNPLFDVLFTLQNNETESLQIEDWSIEQKEPSTTNAKFDLSMTIFDDDGYKISLEFAEELFNQDTVARMLDHYLEILKHSVQQPEQKISDLQMITKQEEAKIFNEFNDTAVPFNNTKTFVEIFEAQVAKTPNEIAITYEGESLTYAMLNAKANQLANYLRIEGVQPNTLVGLMTNRRLEMMIGIYGILKAGGAYVPIDPNYPSDRINYILGDSQPNVLLTDQTLDATIDFNKAVLNLTDDSVVETQSTDNLSKVTDVKDLMYVIYTSGTTGKPKGVMVPYKGVMNRLHWMIDKYYINNEDTILFKTPFTFDVSVWEIFGPTMVGGQAILLPSGEESNPEKITSLIDHHNITMVHFVPSMLGVFIDFIKSTNRVEYIATVNYVLASGEALKAEQVNQFNALIGEPNNSLLIDLYGPTEASIEVIYYPCAPGETYDKIPIGRPIANIQAYIMNEDESLMGIGVPGELCIGGVGVTKGYLNRPDLTDEKFIDNPFGEGKLYRTGDLAKWSTTGNVEYLGRIDEQVKIRGYRIELGEIESLLRQINLISDVAVVAKPMAGEELAICAYLVSDESIDFDEIKSQLNQNLPDYMVPTYMTQIDILPVTSNGKLDKKQLPEIQVESENYVAPTNEIEEMLTNIFGEVLNIERVSIYDNFFEVGGHSLKAINVINKIEGETGIRLPLKVIFESPTVAQLGKVLNDQESSLDGQNIPIAESKSYYLASSPQKRLYVLNEMVQGQTAYNMPSMLEINGVVDVARVEDVFQSLVERHEVLRTHFETIDGEPVQIIDEQANITVDYEETDIDDYETLLNNFVRPFNLRHSPLLRVKIVKLADKRHILLFDIHHIISDGFSINLIIKEFIALYHERTLEQLKVQYKDYSEWMHSRDLSDQRAFWLSQFEDEAPVLDLPYDHSRPKQQSFTGKTISAEMPKETRDALHELAQRTNSTDYMILLSSFMILLHKYSRQEDVVIGSPISGRTHQDTDNLLGMFVNTLPMRAYPENNKAFNQFLDEVRDTALKAYDNQEYPLEELVDEVVERRDLTRNPLFDVLFTLQNNETQDLQIEDWDIKEKQATNTKAKFDLNMMIEDNEAYKVSLEYAAELFEPQTVERMLNHYLKILSEVVQHPAQNISDIDMTTEEERTQILDAFNDTYADLPNNQTFVERFEKQVANTPNQTAITFEGESLTYKELNVRVNQLAHKLRAEGVEANSLVGLMTNRSIEMMVSIYGILKAGGAYVPMDPSQPSDRINYILNDSQPTLLITDRPLDTSIEFDRNVIDVTEKDEFANLSMDNLNHITDVSDLMYVIYTSGTTGNPKGVVVPYEGVLNRLNWMIDEYDFTEEDIIMFKTPYTFDVSVWEIFGFAMVGAQAVLLPSGEEGNPSKITSLIQQHAITMIHFVPSMLGVFVDYIKSTNEVAEIASINTVLATGEALKSEQANRFNSIIGQHNDTLLIDLYGPTEASIEVTYNPLPPNQEYDIITIGRPIANVQMYVLNNNNQHTGIGVPGELCIAGVAVTNGYLNRPELTQQQFIDNPFGEGKVYRTGDLAKWTTDGEIEYLGRIDEQVKIRGYRIELGEISSHLLRIENISDAGVIAKPMASEELAICAYLVADQPISFADIKTELARKVPDYMVPAYMTQIEQLPVTSNGKLNKRALPEIEVERQEFVEPRNEIEADVVQAMKEVLNTDSISVYDNFFEIGGDSIIAIKLTSLLSKSYNISIKDIFELQTIDRISESIAAKDQTNILTKLEMLKNIDTAQGHQFSSEFIQEINEYKEESVENYEVISSGAVKQGKNVLLTGATGFFGIYMLNNLLEDTDFNIYVMVRSNKEVNGETKLYRNWIYYFESQIDPEYAERIHIIEGNIELEKLGMTSETYESLSQNIDMIVNAAANVSHFATTDASYGANVGGIEQLIQFAKYNQSKEIHHMSTISIASGKVDDKAQLTFSEHDLDLGQVMNNVYLDTKIEAEKVLIASREQGVETNIYRLGNLQCDSRTGVFQKNEENNAFYSIIKSFRNLEIFPDLENDDLEFTPVDQAAKACSQLIKNNQLNNEIHHIYNNNHLSLKQLMHVYNQNNYHIKDVQWNEFVDYLMHCIKEDVMSDQINDFLLHTGVLDNNIFNKSHFEVLDFKTNFILEKLNFKWQPTEDETLSKMISHPKNNF
ncbi:non-ribosomal peptide synthase/polyketide synthase [Staphylococcus saprophyticus]|uniref:non-ribosomal peptide synthase/polyketide synthase n=1 Tax=Staphylococcus xylosus TaxID=1288 RepID=UPI0010739546|nr:non-ribosomal peptide synthase/polyketide synthase [Staphylococcus xylosus]MBF0813751.1 non-ribosomal peptide synthase/polyketide synthase [Staphylococcus saprophyticus]TFV23698.1 amino acid adenylation domain-containing protein [Staphylococcus saprophyticus]